MRSTTPNAVVGSSVRSRTPRWGSNGRHPRPASAGDDPAGGDPAGVDPAELDPAGLDPASPIPAELDPATGAARQMAALGEIGPPVNTTRGVAASGSQPATASATGSAIGWLSTNPSAPSAVCSSTNTTARAKSPSVRTGAATSSRPCNDVSTMPPECPGQSPVMPQFVVAAGISYRHLAGRGDADSGCLLYTSPSPRDS